MGETKIGYRADLAGILNPVLMLRPAYWPEGERIGGRWGYKYLGVYDTDEEAAKLRSTPRSPVLR